MEILTKRQSTDGYKNGRFGNHLRQWNKPSDAVGKAEKFSLRYRGPGANGVCLYHMPFHQLVKQWAELVCYPFPEFPGTPYPENWLYVSESAPDDRLTFQGEICELPNVGGYALHYSTEKVPQRVALRTGSQKLGPGALLMCKQFMDGDSYDDLRTLLDLYPLHVVEFSCFNVRLGNLRRNTIFWEVRKF